MQNAVENRFAPAVSTVSRLWRGSSSAGRLTGRMLALTAVADPVSGEHGQQMQNVVENLFHLRCQHRAPPLAWILLRRTADREAAVTTAYTP
jgi:hypothetical protein